MRPRTEIAIGFGTLASLLLLAVAGGRGQRGAYAKDARASTFNTDPAGWHAMAAVLERQGTRVMRSRARLTRLPPRSGITRTIVVANPVELVSADEVVWLFGQVTDGDQVVVAGTMSASIMGCAGYRPAFRILDSARVLTPDRREGGFVNAHLVRLRDTVRTLAGDLGARDPCPALAVRTEQILLSTVDDSLVGVRLTIEDSPGSLLLLADASVLSNKGLRAPAVPELLLSSLVAPGGEIVFAEHYQGHGAGGSLAADAWRWSLAHPFGWGAWQLAVVGLLAWLLGAIRYGQVMQSIRRERRSSLEHVRALATALAASRGHAVAIRALVRGLQRRLVSSGHDGRGRARAAGGGDQWRSWLQGLPARLRDPGASRAAQHLLALTAGDQSDAAVRAAANSVEDVWEALH